MEFTPRVKQRFAIALSAAGLTLAGFSAPAAPLNSAKDFRHHALANPCPRPAPGSEVSQAPDLFSQNGVLEVNLDFNTIVSEADGFSAANALQLFCYSTPDGKESPTLHVWPGDKLVIHLTNSIPSGTLVLEQDGTINEHQAPGTDNTIEQGMKVDSPCLDSVEEAASTNIHFHGLNLAATCGVDDVMHTVVNPGHTFTYAFTIPKDQPPGLYWYHPHIHGINEGVVQGGASAAIIVEGIQNLQPAAAGLPTQTLVIRDLPVPGYPTPTIGSEVPSWDLSVNYVTVRSCQDAQPCDASKFVGDFTAATMHMKPGEKQLWRVLNAASHTALDLQLVFDGKPQTLAIVGLDGVPVNSQDGTKQGTPISQDHISMAPGMRAEFIVTAPDASVKSAVLKTLRVPTGPSGDNHPERPLISIQASLSAKSPALKIGMAATARARTTGANLKNATPTAQRKLFFSEVLSDPNNNLSPTNFFLTPDGATPGVYDPSAPPAVVTKQGAIEDWTIENRSQEDHVFHIHQLHFLVLERNGVPVPPEQQQYMDLVNLPFWTGSGPYPSVKVRMDFGQADPGDLMIHCHYIFHADFGMMAVVRVLPKDATAKELAAAEKKPGHHHMMHHDCTFKVRGRCMENGKPVNWGSAGNVTHVSLASKIQD